MSRRTTVLVPVYREIGKVNFWHVSQVTLQTADGAEPIARVVLESQQRAEDGVTVLGWVEQREVVIEGEELTRVMGDAFRRAKALRSDSADVPDVAARVNPGDALFIGMREAVYDALVRSGLIPGEAEPVAG